MPTNRKNSNLYPAGGLPDALTVITRRRRTVPEFLTEHGIFSHKEFDAVLPVWKMEYTVCSEFVLQARNWINTLVREEKSDPRIAEEVEVVTDEHDGMTDGDSDEAEGEEEEQESGKSKKKPRKKTT